MPAYSPKRQFGNIGENVACAFLTRHGFEIVERNYLRKWGEIDIVAKKESVLHFIEVKSTRVRLPNPLENHSKITPKTGDQNGIRPEENMHPQKLRRLARVTQTYMVEKHLDMDWQIDLAVVSIDEDSRRAACELLENISI